MSDVILDEDIQVQLLIQSETTSTIENVNPVYTLTELEAGQLLLAGQEGPQGPVGPAGATGPVGPAGPSGASYTHTQGASSNVWTITHGLNTYPSVTVIDSAYSTVVGSIQYITTNSLTVTFTAPFSGVAHLV